MDDLKTFLIEKVLLFESDTLSPEAEKVLSQIRREKTDVPVVYVSSNSSSIIAGSEKTYNALKLFAEENEPGTVVIKVGCAGPANYEPVICIQMPGKNKLYFRNITEEKVEPLMNGVFHNDISCILGTGETCLHHSEAGLHKEYKSNGDHKPYTECCTVCFFKNLSY